MKFRLVYNKKARVLNTKRLFLIFAFLALVLLPFGISGIGDTLTDDLTKITKDDVFKELVSNDAGKTEAVFKLQNVMNTEQINRNDIKINFNEVCGKVNSYNLLINSTCEAERVKEEIYDTREVCYNQTFVNKTIYENYTYPCFKEFEKIDATDLRNIKIDADVSFDTCSDGTFGFQIDWIPEITLNDGITLKILDKPEWAWWNVSYDSKRNITSVPDVDLTLNVNGTTGFYGNRIFVNPANCKGDLAIYYKSTNTSDYAVVCNDTTEITWTSTNLLAYYKFDVSETPQTDEKGVYDLTVSSATFDSGDGKINSSYLWDAVDDYMSNGVLLDTTPSAISVSFWFKLTETFDTDSTNNIVFCSKQNVIWQEQWYLALVYNTGELIFVTEEGNNGLKRLETTQTSWTAGVWYHIVATWDTTNGKILYVNGTNVADDDTATTLMGSGTAQPFIVGNQGAHNRGDIGNIDEFGLWSRVLNSTEVETNYNNTKDSFDNMLLGAEESAPPVGLTVTAHNTSPSTVYTNTDFKLNLTITDREADTLTGYVQFYINGSSSGAEQSTSPVTNNTNTLIGTLSSSNFYEASTLIAEYWAGDGTENTTKENTTQVTVQSFVMGGTVKDSSNIVVNNAKVIIINQATNTITGTTDSNSTGGWTYNIGTTGTYIVVSYDPNNSTRDGDADPHIIVS